MSSKSQLTRRVFNASLAGGVVASVFARHARAESDTVKIGMVTALSGPAAASGGYALNGAKLALENVNKAGGILGKKAELVVEDDQGTNPGAVLAFSKLTSQPDIVAFIGEIRSTQMMAMSPDILKAGKPIMYGGTDPQLSQQGNPWLFRCQPTDADGAREIAKFGSTVLGKKKWAEVHSTDTYGSTGSRLFTEALKTYGAQTVVDLGYTNQTQDFTAIVLSVKQSDAEILNTYMTFENDLGVFARQLRQLGVSIPWVGSASIMNTSAIKLAGPALNGVYGVGGFAEADDVSKAFAATYTNIYKVAADTLSAWPYDGVTILGRAINDAGKTDPEAIRQSILDLKGFVGAMGPYRYTANGDGVHTYNIVTNKDGKVVFLNRVSFD
jgi:branched-chain amino acid transport system substrate-binding protein